MIPLFKPFIPPWDELGPALKETFDSGYIAQGPKVEEFERKFGEYIGNPNVVAVSSCTAALHLALILAGVGPGDEVISTPMTAEPTNLAILYTGAKIVWADVDPFNGNIDLYSVRDKSTSKTKAVMVVHYGGVPTEMRLLGQRGMIEDCAHALGAKLNGVQVGTENLGCFSFQAIKHLTTVEGGILSLPSDRYLVRARKLRWFGIDRRELRTEVDIKELGYKYNLNEIAATLGLLQLKNIDWVIDRHRDNGDWFDKFLPYELLQGYPLRAQPSYWFYTLLIDQGRRDHLQKHLQDNGIGCGTVHRRNDMHSLFFNRGSDRLGHFSGLAQFGNHALHIPCGWWVGESERDQIAQTIKDGLAQ